MDKINILCTPDDNYVPYCGIMLTSLFENNKGEEFNVFIMCESLDTKNIEDFERLSKQYNVRIEIKQIDKTIFKECPIRLGDHVSIAAYYRLIAAKILPEDIDKILYLDCDVIINGSIKDLYNTDISEFAFGAVMDEAYFFESKYERLCYDKKYNYINSGVLLFNIDFWRKNDTTNECLEYISKYPERVRLHDQDTLNAVCHKKIKILPIKYNLQTGFILTQFTYEKQVKSEIDSCSLSPVIIHFTGRFKPWHKYSKHPYTRRFLHYKKISIWNSLKIIDNTNLIEKAKRYMLEIIWFLGIKKRPKSYIIKKQN